MFVRAPEHYHFRRSDGRIFFVWEISKLKRVAGKAVVCECGDAERQKQHTTIYTYCMELLAQVKCLIFTMVVYICKY